MKKILSLLLVLAIVFSLGACAKIEESATFKFSENGVTILITYNYVGDKVITQTAYNVVEYAKTPFKTKEAILKEFEPVSKLYRDVAGIEYKVEYGEEKLIEDLKVTYAELDLEKAKNIPGFLQPNGVTRNISYKKSEKMLLDAGFEKVG